METDLIRERIRQFREKKGYLQRDMADLLNMTQRNYARIERGEHKILDINLLAGICKVLNINIVELLIPEEFVLSDKSCVLREKQIIQQSQQQENEFKKYISDHLDKLILMQREFELQNREILDVLENKLAVKISNRFASTAS